MVFDVSLNATLSCESRSTEMMYASTWTRAVGVALQSIELEAGVVAGTSHSDQKASPCESTS